MIDRGYLSERNFAKVADAGSLTGFQLPIAVSRACNPPQSSIHW